MSRGQAASISKTLEFQNLNDDPPTIENATSLTQVQEALQSLRTRHAAVTQKLDDTLDSHGDVSRHISRLDLSRARLGTLGNSARALGHGQLSSAASTASRLSEAVSRLDLEQDRVKATLSVVEQVSELKSCVLGVVGSMGAPQDWETAAQYIHRASQIPREVTTSGFAEDNVPTAEVPDPPAVTLDSAAQSLCQLFLKEFAKAVEEGDGARITRFFKMFPLIRRSKEGLDAYGRYVCQGVASRARGRLQGVSANTDGASYVQALTKLFEHIAQVVDGHTHLVQRHYGTGTMTKVMERLHMEADVQGGIILDTWNDERTVDRKLTDVKSYAYTFLVQSFLPAPKGSAGTPRSGSPALKGSGKTNQDQLDDGIDMKEIEKVLNEITAMLGHWSLYLRFISSRAVETSNEDLSADDVPELSVPPFLANSNLPKKVTRILTEPFKSFATFVLRRSVEKAFQMEEFPSGLSLNNTSRPFDANPPYITSVVDDVMYMVSQVLQRSIATCQADVVTSIISSVGRVLGSDFIGMIQRKMRDECYPKPAIQGAAPPEDKVISFLVLINNLEVATNYIERIVHTHTGSNPSAAQQQKNQIQANGHTSPLEKLQSSFPLNNDGQTVLTALNNLQTSFTLKANDLSEDGLNVAFTHVLKPRIRPFLAEIFRDADYSSAEDPRGLASLDAASAAHQNGDESSASAVRLQAERGWDALTKPLKKLLTASTSSKLMHQSVVYLSALLEKRIWNFGGRISEMGAVRLERDVSDLANTVVRGERFGLRDEFARCVQIVEVVNLDGEEWAEVEAQAGNGTTGGGGEEEEDGRDEYWVLSRKERQRARGLIRYRE
ncbi:MAG: hypothetical protein M1831_006230 [Alyxoria varia]|nr:MAG: hypothetical protein M1831_006230 [Alyxoria varia]